MAQRSCMKRGITNLLNGYMAIWLNISFAFHPTGDYPLGYICPGYPGLVSE